MKHLYKWPCICSLAGMSFKGGKEFLCSTRNPYLKYIGAAIIAALIIIMLPIITYMPGRDRHWNQTLNLLNINKDVLVFITAAVSQCIFRSSSLFVKPF